MRRLRFLLLATALTAACTDAELDESEPSAPNQLRDDGKADDAGPLWAGLTSVTIERYASDPCNDGRNALGDDPVIYDDWARQRATIRNLCFEVWKPGVTDWDNPEFWRQLDVQVHHRHGSTGPFEWAYVNSIDRRGNNRRYAWGLDFYLDPTVMTPSVPAMKAPFQIVSEGDGWVRVTADLELYFTVNGQVLNAPANRPFVVRYGNYLRVPTLAPEPDGYVLHDIVTCGEGAARFGSGAGFFAADIRDSAAIAALGAGLDGSLIYGVGVAHGGSGSSELLQMTYLEQFPVAGEPLPGFRDRGGLRITPDGTAMRVELDVYDRALGETRQLAHTFTDCASPATN